MYPQGPLAGDQLWSVRGGRRRGDGRLPLVLVLVVLLLCHGFKVALIEHAAANLTVSLCVEEVNGSGSVNDTCTPNPLYQ